MTGMIARRLLFGLCLVAFGGCRTPNAIFPAKCARCANGTCETHNKPDDSDGVTSPSSSPFVPFTNQNSGFSTQNTPNSKN